MVLSTQLTTHPHIAAEVIRSGGIVAFPTETVYGLGADIFNKSAIEKIFEAKQRPPDNPLIAHVSSLNQMTLLTNEVTDNAKSLVDAFFPGPLTVVLKRSARVPYAATAGLDTIGIRMPEHSLARRFLAACGTPVAAPSANLSGRPSPTTWQAVLEDLNGRIDCILQGDPTDIGLESTVVDCTVDPPLLLRKGAVSIEELRRVVAGTRADEVNGQEDIRSPGLRHRHYTPSAKIILVEPDLIRADTANSAYIGLVPPVWDVGKRVICGSVEDYAQQMFEFFRECDRLGIEKIYCQMVDEVGIGSALMDRLRRAASA